MLIQFTVGNYLSFKEPVTFSMVAASRLVSRYKPELDEENVLHLTEDLTLLKTAAIYGANASGKSNLAKAMSLMRDRVTKPPESIFSGLWTGTTPFRLSKKTESEPSFFEVVFMLDGITYRYGFELDQIRVVSEWLFSSTTGRETRLFVRDEDDFTLGRTFKEGRRLKELTNPNTLFIQVCSQFKGAVSTSIRRWFYQFHHITGLNDSAYLDFTVTSFHKGWKRKEIVDLIQKLDLGIEEIISQEFDASIPEKEPPQYAPNVYHFTKMDDFGEGINIITRHRKEDENGKLSEEADFNIIDESAGTQKLFFLTGPILTTLEEGSILVVDEMEARLHTHITRAIVNLFNSKETNPKGAQLIFTTHDTNLLSREIFRRDQIWFVEKDSKGASHLYSLAEIKVRNDASYESDYLQGRYGAIPILGELREIVIDE